MNENYNSGSYNSDGTYNPEYTGSPKKKSFPWGKVIALMLVAALLGGAVVYMHRSNIGRILAGKENRFTFHVKPQITSDKEKK